MPKSLPPRPRSVREPAQVYLATDDRDLLARLTQVTGLSKAEVLRRGLRSFAREQGGESPMLRFLEASAGGEWPSALAGDHDAALTEAYLGRAVKRR